MSVKIVNISDKEDTYREVEVEGFIELKSRLDVNLPENFIFSIVNYATRNAYRYIPLLHPVPIREVVLLIKSYENYIKLNVKGWTIAKTGIEMDLLFGLSLGLIACHHYLTLNNVEITRISNICVKKKIKLPMTNTSPLIRNIEEKELSREIKLEEYEDGDEAVTTGSIVLKEETIDKIIFKRVEKGDVLTVAKTVSLLNAKRVSELLPLRVKMITSIEQDITVRENKVNVISKVKVKDKYRPLCESLFATFTALLTVWDMVKKYEKNSEGQYPYTMINDVKVLTYRKS